MTVIFTGPARKQVRDINAHSHKTYGPMTAQIYVQGMQNTLSHLDKNPGTGRKRDELGPNILSFPRGSHMIFYRLVPGGIEVLAVIHQRDDVGKYFS